MPTGNIDYDRGVIINSDPLSGMDVFMYVDNPGVYLTAHSNVVADEIARRSGYDIEYLAKEKTRLDRKKQAIQMIDEELADDKDNKTETVCERNGYKVITTGSGRHHVSDPDGNRLTNVPMSEESALKLMNAMAGADSIGETAVKLNDKLKPGISKK